MHVVGSLEDKCGGGATKDPRSFQGSELKATESPQLLNLHHHGVEGWFFISQLCVSRVKFG